MKIPLRTETANSAARLKCAHELDAQFNQTLSKIKTAYADFADGEVPTGFIGRDGFTAFIKSRGQTLGLDLTAADKDGLAFIILLLSAGAVVSRETILKCLREFNPARETELVA